MHSEGYPQAAQGFVLGRRTQLLCAPPCEVPRMGPRSRTCPGPKVKVEFVGLRPPFRSECARTVAAPGSGGAVLAPWHCRPTLLLQRRLLVSSLSPAGYKAKLLAVGGFPNTITPVLTVRNALAAVAFYEQALGAEVIFRNTCPDGKIVAEMAIGAARFRVADEATEATTLSPETLQGTSVRINLLVADPDLLMQRAIASGAVEVAPIADQPYGLRQGRLADPFGHHWLIGRPLADGSGDWVRRVGSR